MAKRSRERELTPEEAIEQARVQLSPFWLPNPPLLAGVKPENGTAQAFPLDPSFAAKRWVILALNPTAGSAEDHVRLWRELIRRYHSYDLNFICLVASPYKFYHEPKVIEYLANQYKTGEIVTVDPDGALIEALGRAGAEPPFVVVFEEGKQVAYSEGPRWFEALEAPIHQFLRLKDPGLALLPFYRRDRPPLEDVGGWDFAPHAPMAGLSPFTSTIPPEVQKDKERIVIKDDKTIIRFECPSNSLAIVAEGLEPAGRASEIVVELNRQACREANWGLDAVRNEQGNSGIRVVRPRLYLMLKDLAERAARHYSSVSDRGSGQCGFVRGSFY